MIKKIELCDVRLGMYIHKICGKWMEHPFWNHSFLLSEQKDLSALKQSNVKVLWIDTNKGLDVDINDGVKIESDLTNQDSDLAVQKT